MRPHQASTTAKLVAASLVLLDSDTRTRGLVADGAAALSERLLDGHWLAASARCAPARRGWRALERWLLPGIVEHYALRKRWIERQCREAIAGGCERLVVLGAGFDTLGCRLAQEMHGLEVIEIDHPATQAAKRHALDALVPPLQRPPRFIACDLAREALPQVLLNDARATVVVAEGLLMYLSADAVHRLFDAVRALSQRDVQLVFSHIVRWPDGRAGFRPCSCLVNAWLAWRGEPFTWAIEPNSVPALLSRHGFALVAGAAPTELAEGVTLQGENLVRCRAV